MTIKLTYARNTTILLLALLTNFQTAFSQTETNPLLQKWNTPFQSPPFDLIKAKDFEPAFGIAMERHLKEMDAICSNPDAPTFENTLVALENAGKDLSRVQRTFSALTASATNDELRTIQSRMAPQLAAHSSKITLNADLFARIDNLYEKRAKLGLDAESTRVLELTHKRFVRAGAKLKGKDRQRLAAISKELAGLYTAFSQNVQKSTEAFALVLKNKEDRAGLPDFVLSSASQAARDRGLEGHVITLARSSFEPFMTFSTRRDLREKLYTGWTNRGDNQDGFNNQENIRRILQLRLERAQLLGYQDFSAYRTANTMAGTPEAAKKLLDEVWVGAVAKADQELKRIQGIMKKEGVSHELRAWDWWHYAEKARAAFFALDEDAVKAHLSLENVLRAQFAVAGRLFGIRFIKRNDIPAYHPDVQVWEVKNSENEHVGLFYGDYFARPGKRGGAWMSALRTQNHLGEGSTPLIMNNCNYNKPVAGKPALISMREAEVVFHEFGHALHGLLSNVTYGSIAGTAVDYDFVEFPAQIFEHWMRQPEVIKEFALHHETGKPMPTELIERLKKAANAQSGFDNVEYIASAFVDLAFHRITNPEVLANLDINSFEDGVLAQARIPKAIEMRHRSPHFGHAFAGELYASGYYTYLWAGVLDNDGFAAFEEANDLYDKSLAKKLYENVYSAGNRRTAMEADIGFRGREPSTAPLLRNRGLDLKKKN